MLLLVHACVIVDFTVRRTISATLYTVPALQLQPFHVTEMETAIHQSVCALAMLDTAGVTVASGFAQITVRIGVPVIRRLRYVLVMLGTQVQTALEYNAR